jgi:SpoVK/Ycf46/Vps4 family AAA+-type ATPase
LLSYPELLDDVAKKCEGFSGAALAGVARAAASHALERAVNEFSDHVNGNSGQPTSSIMDCLVNREDLYSAVEDVMTSMGNSDHSEEEEDDVSDETKDSPEGDEEESSNGNKISPE